MTFSEIGTRWDPVTVFRRQDVLRNQFLHIRWINMLVMIWNMIMDIIMMVMIIMTRMMMILTISDQPSSLSGSVQLSQGRHSRRWQL